MNPWASSPLPRVRCEMVRTDASTNPHRRAAKVRTGAGVFRPAPIGTCPALPVETEMKTLNRGQPFALFAWAQSQSLFRPRGDE